MEKPQNDSSSFDPNAPTLTPLHHDSRAPQDAGKGSTISIGATNKALEASLPGLPDLKDLSVTVQDLISDKLLLAAPRFNYSGQNVPSLGGIPLLAKLGSGGMGSVYFGIHPRLKLEVAVKILPFQLAEHQPDLIARFFREAKLAATVESPHLVRVTDVNEDSGLYYLVMEYVNGITAGSFLKTTGKPGLDEVIALDIIIAATEGLAAAHDEDIIHRDIKPDNIMIPRQRHKHRAAVRSEAHSDALVFTSAKLSDLGLARGDESDKSLTVAESVMGTPGYMAPEQAVDAKTAGKPADVFSIGATLYALLCGTTPYAGGTKMETILATIQKPHHPLKPRRPSTSDATCALVERTLMKNPAQRFTDASELLDALRQCRGALSGATTLSTAPTSGSRDSANETVLSAHPAATTPIPATPATTPIPVPPATTPTPAPASWPPAPAPSSNKAKLILAASIFALAGAALLASYKFGQTEEKKALTPLKTTETPPEQQKEDPRFKEEVLKAQERMAANDYVAAKTSYSIAKTLAVKKETREFAENGLLAAERAGFNAKMLEGEAALANKHLMDAKLAFQAAHDIWPESPDTEKVKAAIEATEKAMTKRRAEVQLNDAMVAAYAAEDEPGRDAAYKKGKWEEALKKATEGTPEYDKIKARIENWSK
jgi:serine/threonine protein kinase